jgi:uncharacterized protein YciI
MEDKALYVMFIERGKTYNKLTRVMVEKHVEHLKRLDEAGKIELCGAFKGYPGIAGMVVLKAASLEEADELCKTEPLVTEGFATYKLREFYAANEGNNYLL